MQMRRYSAFASLCAALVLVFLTLYWSRLGAAVPSIVVEAVNSERPAGSAAPEQELRGAGLERHAAAPPSTSANYPADSATFTIDWLSEGKQPIAMAIHIDGAERPIPMVLDGRRWSSRGVDPTRMVGRSTVNVDIAPGVGARISDISSLHVTLRAPILARIDVGVEGVSIGETWSCSATPVDPSVAYDPGDEALVSEVEENVDAHGASARIFYRVQNFIQLPAEGLAAVQSRRGIAWCIGVRAEGRSAEPHQTRSAPDSVRFRLQRQLERALIRGTAGTKVVLFSVGSGVLGPAAVIRELVAAIGEDGTALFASMGNGEPIPVGQSLQILGRLPDGSLRFARTRMESGGVTVDLDKAEVAHSRFLRLPLEHWAPRRMHLRHGDSWRMSVGLPGEGHGLYCDGFEVVDGRVLVGSLDPREMTGYLITTAGQVCRISVPPVGEVFGEWLSDREVRLDSGKLPDDEGSHFWKVEWRCDTGEWLEYDAGNASIAELREKVWRQLLGFPMRMTLQIVRPGAAATIVVVEQMFL
jgi:hypothetical protein